MTTQFAKQNDKMVFSVQPTHLPLKTSGATKYFFVVKHPTYTIGNRKAAQNLYLLYHNFI